MLKKIAAAALIASLSISPALAQSQPGWTQNFKPTVAQWAAQWASKQDVLGYTPFNQAGGSFTGRVVVAPPGASLSAFNVPPGSVPGSPANGDVWSTSAGFFARVNGVTVNFAQFALAVAPTILSGCGGGSPSISSSNGARTFRITIGTASGSTCVLTMPAASVGWNCVFNDLTTMTAANLLVRQTASSSTTVTLGGFSNIGGAATWVAADVVTGICSNF